MALPVYGHSVASSQLHHAWAGMAMPFQSHTFQPSGQGAAAAVNTVSMLAPGGYKHPLEYWCMPAISSHYRTDPRQPCIRHVLLVSSTHHEAH